MLERKINQKKQKKTLSAQRIIASFLLLPLLSISVYLYSHYAHAAITKEISYQGKLTNTSGVAVADGNYNMIISLYTVSTGGTPVWTARGTVGTPTTRSVAVSNGIFSIMLGDTAAGDNALNLDFNSTYYLGIKVGSDSEMTPRKKVGASGYAFNSDLLDGLDSATSGADAHIVATDASGSLFVSGNVGIGTTNPTAKLGITDSITDLNGKSGIYQNINITQSLSGYTNYGYKMVVDNDLSWGSNTTYGIHVTNNGSAAGAMHGIYAYALNNAIYGQGGANGVYGDNSLYGTGVGVYGKTTGTSSGNAMKAESTNITSSSLVFYNQASSSFSGTGLLMNFANGSGSFSGNFLNLQKNGVSQLLINSNGQITGGSYNGITLAAAADGFSLSGGTVPRLLTISGADISIDQSLRKIDSPTFAGLNVSGMIKGSVTFIGDSGALIQDNANFFWDDENNRLGIGTTSPAYGLHVNGIGYFAGLAGPGAEHRLKSQTTGIIMPMYIYPTDIYTNTDYNRVIDLKKKYHDVPLYVILNPDSGPGSVADGNYTKAIQRLRGAGVVVLGYVATTYGEKSLANVATEVSTWKSLYPDVDGIFFDEMSNDTSDIAYYVSAKQDVHSKGLNPVIGNPGTALDASFFNAQTADFYITYENSSYPSEATLEGDWDGGNVDFPYRDRGAIVYNESWNADTIRMMRKYAGLIYVTNDDVLNPWDSVSSYLEDLFSVLASDNDSIFVDVTTGYVGIGTTSPSANLDVNGNIKATNIGFLDTVPDSNYGIYAAKNYVDPAASHVASFNSGVTFTGNESVLENFYSINNNVKPIINAGHTNTGSIVGYASTTLRNFNGASADDGGSLSSLVGASFSYGHYNSTTSANPQTTNAYGVRIMPRYYTGTITNMYDIYLQADTTGGTVTNRFGIYQENTANNYFAGNIGIGTTTPLDKLYLSGSIGAEGSMKFYKPSVNESKSLYNMSISGVNGLQIKDMGTGGNSKLYLLNSSDQLNSSLSFNGENSYLNLLGGNVGIGTSNPAEILDVNGRLHLFQATAPETTTDKLYNVTGNLYWNGINLSGGGALPSGSEGQMMYNNAGAWTAFDGIYWDDTNSRLGIGTTSPLSKLHVANYINNQEDTRAVRLAEYPAITSNGTYNSYGTILQANPNIASGITNSGSASASRFYAFRNATGTGDSGTLNTILGSSIAYGHSNLDAAATPQTNKVYGMQIYPYALTGTIGSAYDLYIGPTQGSESNITNHYGIYQASSLVKNYFAGNVGIGTLNPSGKLNVYTGLSGEGATVSSIASGSIAFANVASSNAIPGMIGRSDDATGMFVGSGTNDSNTNGDMAFNVRENDNTDFSTLTSSAFKFSRYTTNLMTILRNGNVGVNNSSPQLKLDVVGNMRFGLGNASGNGRGYLGGVWTVSEGYKFATLGSTYFNGTNWITNEDNNFGSNNVSVMASDVEGIKFYTQTTTGNTQRSDSMATFNTYERMRIDMSGNVGIGTTAPGTLLETYSGSVANMIKINRSTAENANIQYTNTIGSMYAGLNSAAGWAVGPSADLVNTPYFTIAASTGKATLAGDLTINGDDLFMATNTAGYLLVADGTNYNPVAMSGDVTITSAGVTTIGADALALGTNTTGNYVAGLTAGTAITIGGTAGEGWSPTVSVTADSLDFTELQDTLDLDANLITNQGTYTSTQNFTGTTAVGYTYNANSLTTGTGMLLSTSSLTSGNMLNVRYNNAADTVAFTGNLGYFNLTSNWTGASSPTNSGNMLEAARSITMNSATYTNTVSGAVLRVSDAATLTAGAFTHAANTLEIVQSYTGNTGAAVNVTTAGTGLALRVNDDGTFADSTPFVINASGSVGIGTTSPSAQLHTTGTVRFANFGAGTLSTDASGNVTVSSDERLKDVQGSFNRGIDELMGISPIIYKWNKLSGLDRTSLYAGFSAQNIQLNIPEAVDIDPRGYLTLSDRPILATAVNAIKEQQLNIINLDLKTNTNITTVKELQESINQQLGIIENKFAVIDSTLKSTEKTQSEHETRIGSLEEKNVQQANISAILQSQMDLIKQQNQTILDFAVALDIEKLIYKDESGNLDLKTGKLITAEVVAGAFTVKVTDENNKTIGEAKIKAITKDENKDGIDDETDSDGKSVMVKTGAVGKGSKIFVTTNIATEFPLAVTKKIEGEGFIVEMKNTVSEDISFDWWIVESEK